MQNHFPIFLNKLDMNEIVILADFLFQLLITNLLKNIFQIFIIRYIGAMVKHLSFILETLFLIPLSLKGDSLGPLLCLVLNVL